MNTDEQNTTRNPLPTEDNKPQWQTQFKEWGWQLISSVFIVMLIKWLLFDIYIIPTPSMERNLRVGDLLLVSKLSYGARSPRTLLQVPLTNGRIWGTNWRSYLDWIQLPSFRLPGIGKVERGEIVVFHYPAETNRPLDVRTFYVKRCIAAAKDTLHIVNGEVFVNQAPDTEYEELQTSYIVKTSKVLNPRVFQKLDIPEVQLIPQGYLIHTRQSIANTLAKNPVITSVEPLKVQADYNDERVFPQSKRYNWNIDHFGPLVIPYEGMEIILTDSLLALYGNTIVAHEELKDASLEADGLYVEGEKLTQYRFGQDYFFMMGDNRHNSEDSRYWGFVPMNHVVGKPKLSLMSFDKNTGIFSKFRWSRLLHPVQ